MYTLDPEAARKADSIGSSIKEIGKYVGVFTQAEDIVAKSGTRGIALNFDSNGQKARLSLYTVMKDGKQIMGFDSLMAILTCLNVKGIKPVEGTVVGWNYDTKTETKKQGKIFPELCGKPIGLLLETEEYLSSTGEVKTRMALKAVFQAATELTATEIIERKTIPTQLPRMVAALRHHPVRGINKPANGEMELSPHMAGFDDEHTSERMPWEQ
jgi:hypothetical protein